MEKISGNFGGKMTPGQFCEYVVSGMIFEEVSSKGADYEDLARNIWPARYEEIRKLAIEVLKGLENETKEKSKLDGV